MKQLILLFTFTLSLSMALGQGNKLKSPKGQAPEKEEEIYVYENILEIVTLDLTQTSTYNPWFDGSYTSKYTPNSYGAYSSGSYTSSPDFRVILNNLDYTNFYIETEFNVEKYQNAPIFSLSEYYRMIEMNLTDRGTVELALNNNAQSYALDSQYSLNTWHVVRVEVLGPYVSAYMDGSHLLTVSVDIIRNYNSNKADISTTSFGKGEVLEGYLNSFSIGKVQ